MTSETIAKNAFYNVLAFSVNFIVTFLLVPIMLGALGPIGFGVWAIVRVFVNYASLGDFGLNSTVTKYVAEYHASNDRHAIVRVVQCAFVLYLAIGIILISLAFLFEPLIVATFFASSGEFAGVVSYVLIGSLLIFGTNLAFSVFSSALVGIQRMDITNGVLAFFSLINGGLMIGALAMGYGLKGLVWANGLATCYAIILNGYFYFKLLGNGILRTWTPNRQNVLRLFRYSRHIFVGAVAHTFHMHFDKLLLSSFLSLSLVSSYEVASRVIIQARQIPVLMLQPLLPAASDFEARQATENLRSLYLRSMKYVFVLAVPVLGFLGAFAEPFTIVWLGVRDHHIILTLQILVFANFVNLMTGPGYFISLGIGRPDYSMYSAVVGLVIHVVLSVVLVQILGYYGAVMGSFVALIAGAWVFLHLIQRHMAVKLREVLSHLWTPIGSLAIASALALGGGALIAQPLPKFAVMAVLGLGIYVTGIVLLKYFDEHDVGLMRRLWASLRPSWFEAPRETHF
ncbi:MAG: hypothetical protein FJ215_03520 [Ignavibacteria bacterium]|nr:hypothetical protein [Ignavibacteria bacterium]